jgi:stage V sporulation protein G
MEITEVKVFPARDNGKGRDDSRLKAYATIVFDNSFIVRDLKVIEGSRGLFVSMPSRKPKDGTFRDVVHPLNAQMRQMIEEKVIAEYQRIIEYGVDYIDASQEE